MKKYLAILGLAVALSQPVFAQCNTCAPRIQVLNPPVMQQACAPVCQAPITVTPVVTGAACPVTSCNSCSTGYACPLNTCNPCCEKKGFWARFFGY